MAIKVLSPSSPHTFIVQNLGGMTEDELGVISPTIGAPDNFIKLPELTSLTLQLGEDLWGSVLPGVPNTGEALHSGLGVVGACSQLRLDSWEKCTSDPWVLDIIKRGYRIQFRRLPPTFSGVHMTMVKDSVQAQILANEITTLRQKKAIVRISTGKQLTGFYSKYFLVPKKDGGLRPILDLRQLNRFLKVLPFQNADNNTNFRIHRTRRMVRFHRPEGRIFPCAHLSRSSPISSLCLSRSGLPVQGPTIWPFIVSKGLHQSGFSSPSSSSVYRNKNSSIPG